MYGVDRSGRRAFRSCQTCSPFGTRRWECGLREPDRHLALFKITPGLRRDCDGMSTPWVGLSLTASRTSTKRLFRSFTIRTPMSRSSYAVGRTLVGRLPAGIDLLEGLTRIANEEEIAVG